MASGRVVLMGDAAHGISPILGLGLNLGLQDVLILYGFLTGRGVTPGDIEDSSELLYSVEKILEEQEGSILSAEAIPQVLKNFSELRRPEVVAAVTMCH